jgi:hypothetical protein
MQSQDAVVTLPKNKRRRRDCRSWRSVGIGVLDPSCWSPEVSSNLLNSIFVEVYKIINYRDTFLLQLDDSVVGYSHLLILLEEVRRLCRS